MTEPNDQQRRSQIWYALYSLESLLAETLGRPRSIRVIDIVIHDDKVRQKDTHMASYREFCAYPGPKADPQRSWLDFLSTYRPGPHLSVQDVPSEARRKESLVVDQTELLAYVLHRTRLCLISHRIENAIYCDLQDQTWSDVQKTISRFEDELQEWVATLPAGVSLQREVFLEKDARSNMELAMYYYSIRMILHRPCLCPLEGKIPNESLGSRDFNTKSAGICISAAMAMIAEMPEVSTAQEACRLPPWWGLLHYLCQATAVLVLELSLDAQHVPDRVDEIFFRLKQSTSYLRCLATTSSSALKAWEIFSDLLLKVSDRFADTDVSDVL